MTLKDIECYQILKSILIDYEAEISKSVPLEEVELIVDFLDSKIQKIQSEQLRKIDKKARENEVYYTEIKDLLKSGCLTSNMMLAIGNFPQGTTIQKIASVCKKMIDNGEMSRIKIKRQTYYELI